MLNMLRNKAENFNSPEITDLLGEVGETVNSSDHSYQLIKYERLDPDSFIWLIERVHDAYVLTVSDREEDLIKKDKIVPWLLNTVEAYELKEMKNENGEYCLRDKFDYIRIYKLPTNYTYKDGLN